MAGDVTSGAGIDSGVTATASHITGNPSDSRYIRRDTADRVDLGLV